MGSPNELSFLPEDYLAQKARRRANILCGAVSAIVAGVIVTAFTVTDRSMRDLEKRYNTVDSAYTEAAKQIQQVRQMHDQQRQIVLHAELAAQLVERVNRSNVLADITNSLPTGVSLVEFTLDTKPHVEQPQGATAFDQKRAALEAQRRAESQVGTLAHKPSPYDVTMKVTGLAENDGLVSGLMGNLKRSRLFKRVELIVSEPFTEKSEKGGENVRKFQIEMMLNPDAEVRQDPRKLTKTATVDLNTK